MRVELLGGAEGQLLMRPVHRVSRVERHHPIPSAPIELGAELAGRAPQLGELAMGRHADPLDGAAHVDGMGPLQMGDPGMAVLVGAEHGVGLAVLIGLVQIIDRQHGEKLAGPAPQGDAPARSKVLSPRLVDVQGDRHGPERAVGETAVVADPFVVGPVEEAGER